MREFTSSSKGKRSFLSSDDEIAPIEFAELYSSVGWGTKENYDSELTKEALSRTSNISVRNKDGKLVGLTRVFSDKVYTTYIADMVVMPEYQRQGIGSEMLKVIRELYKGTGIFCETKMPIQKFLENGGFIRRDNMVVYSKKF